MLGLGVGVGSNTNPNPNRNPKPNPGPKQALVPEMVQHHLEYVSGLEAAWHKAVVEAGAARAAGTAAFDAAATGRAVVGLVQRIAGRGRSSKAEQGKDGV